MCTEKPQLDRIEKLLALNLVKDLDDENQQIKLLFNAGYTQKEISGLLGMNHNTVKTKVRRMRKAGEIND